jgi:TPR repeat protein
LENARAISKDLEGGAYCFKLAVDQGYIDAQNNFGLCLQKYAGVRIDFEGAAHCFRLAADQVIATTQYSHGICLITG